VPRLGETALVEGVGGNTEMLRLRHWLLEGVGGNTGMLRLRHWLGKGEAGHLTKGSPTARSLAHFLWAQPNFESLVFLVDLGRRKGGFREVLSVVNGIPDSALGDQELLVKALVLSAEVLNLELGLACGGQDALQLLL